MTTPNLPTVVEGGHAALATRQSDGPQLFALVDIEDPDRVQFYGLSAGEHTFTVRTDPVTHHTNFGKWRSMESALRRLASITGLENRMALVTFDSVPIGAVTALALGTQQAPVAIAAQGNDAE